MATDLGTTLFAFIKAQVLQARRAREGANGATKVHRRTSSAEVATAVVDANLSGENSAEASGGGGGGGDAVGGGRSSATGASPQAWAKLSYLTYTRDRTSEKMPFPAGMVGLLKAVSDVLNHCVGTGDLAVSVEKLSKNDTLEQRQRRGSEEPSVLVGNSQSGVKFHAGRAKFHPCLLGLRSATGTQLSRSCVPRCPPHVHSPPAQHQQQRWPLTYICLVHYVLFRPRPPR